MANQFIIEHAPELSSLNYDVVIGMSVYEKDRIDWLNRAIESIVNQSYENYVFVIVIDGPVPHTMKQTLTLAAQQSPKIMLVQSESNLGLSACMNHVIEYALQNLPKAQVFFRMDADDISLKHRLLKQLEYLRSHSDIDMLGTSLVEVNEKGRKVGKRLLPQSHEEIKAMLPKRCAINHPTVAIKMDIFKKGYRYREDLRNTQDYFLWVDLCAGGYRFANLSDTLLKFRRVNDFYKRRGLSKSINEYKARFYAMKQLKAYSLSNLAYANAVIVLRFMPSKLIKLAYKLDRYLLNK